MLPLSMHVLSPSGTLVSSHSAEARFMLIDASKLTLVTSKRECGWLFVLFVSVCCLVMELATCPGCIPPFAQS